MSTPFDTIFGKMAKDIVGLFGVQQGDSDVLKGSYNKVANGRVDPNTNVATRVSNIQAIDMSPPIAYKIENMKLGFERSTAPSLIQAGDCQILIAGQDWDTAFPNDQPQTDDVITINNFAFFVVEPNPIYSGNDVAVYKMQVRKGSRNA